MTYVIRDGHLMHAEERKKHKYYAKVKISVDKTRYFYSKEEYQAYLRNQRRGKDSKTISERGRIAIEGFLAKASKVADDAKRGLSRAANDAKRGLHNIQEETSKVINKAARVIQNGKIVASKCMKKATKAVSKFVAKGKVAAVKALKKAKKIASKTITKAKQVARELRKDASKVAKKAKFKAKKVIAKAKEAFSKNSKKNINLLSKFVEKGKKFASPLKLKDILKSKYDARMAFNGARPTSILGKTKQLVRRGKKKVSEVMSKIASSRPVQFAGEIINKGKESAFNVLNAVASLKLAKFVGNVAENGKRKISTLLKKIDKKIVAKVQDKPDGPLSTLPKKKHQTSREVDLEMVNPNYGGINNYEYSTNCANCAVAYDMRRRGYDVEAKPKDPNDKSDIFRVMSMYKEYNITEEEAKSLFSAAYESPEGFDIYYRKVLELVKNNDDFTSYTFTEEINSRLGRNDRDPTNIFDNFPYIRNNLSVSEITDITSKYMKSQGEGARGYLHTVWDIGGSHSMNWEVNNGEVTIYDSQSNKTFTLSEICERSIPAFISRTDDLEPSEEVLDWVLPVDQAS